MERAPGGGQSTSICFVQHDWQEGLAGAHCAYIFTVRKADNITLFFAKYKDYDQLFIQAPVCLALKDHAHFAQFSAKPTIEV